MNIILSTAIEHHSNRNDWIQQLKQLRQTLSPQHEINQIMLPVRRLGIPGLMPDNPPIDEVDQFLSEMSESACDVGLISIPISANDLLHKGGIEVSSINGWIDTAGYANCQHIRFCAIDRNVFTDETHWMFLEVVSYAVDLDIAVTLQGFEDHYTQKTRMNYSQEQQHLIGIESRCNPLAAEEFRHYLHDGITNLLSTPVQGDLPSSLVSNEWSTHNTPLLLTV